MVCSTLAEKRYKTRRYRKQKGKGPSIGLSASAAALILGEVAKPILKNIFGGKKRRRWDKK